jgi:hypothetical protein
MAERQKETSTQSNDSKEHKKKILKASDISPMHKKSLKTQYNFASDVKKHTKTQYSQNFSKYTDIYGAEDLDYDLIDGLYDSTILKRVIKKIASDSVPEMFRLQVVDLEGNRVPEIEEACFIYTARLKRKHIKGMYLSALKYGTAFLYIGNKEEDQLNNMFLLHPKDIKPNINESEGEIESWTYTTQSGEVEIPPEDIIKFAYDPKIGEVYGMSFVGHLVHTLHLLLNTELDLAEIVDKFAVPILQWLIEIGDDEELQEDELEGIVNSLQDQLEYSNDIVTTDRITTDTVGFNEKQYDLVTTLQALKESFGLLTFPMSIIGGKADNLSAIKVQAAQYTNDLQDLQADFSDELIEQLYEPFIEETLGKVPGVDYANIYLVFPVLTTESNADTATWLFPAIRMGLISRHEARAQLKFRGFPELVNDLEFIDPTATYLQEMGLQQQKTNEAPSDKQPKNRSGQGDPQQKKEEDKQNK